MKIKCRKMLSSLKGLELTQGILFNNVALAGFASCEIWGVVITARCDIAQDKARYVHFCPIVSVKDWIDVYGWQEVKKRITSANHSNMEKILKENGISEMALKIVEPKEVYDKSISGNINIKKDSKTNFKKFLDKYLLANKISDANSIATSFSGELRSYVKEIVNNKITGLIFLDNIRVGENPSLGYVVLLRDVCSITKELAQKIKVGLSQGEFLKHCNTSLEDSGRLKFMGNDFCCPCSKLNSPFIEYLLQQFSLLFSRIGIEDVDQQHIENICNRYSKEEQK